MTGIETEAIIQTHYNDISTIAQQIRDKKQMYKDALANDAEYREKAEEIKKAKKELKAIEQKLIKENDGIQAVMMKLKELSEQKKDLQLALFTYIDMYKRETNNEMIPINGELFKMVEIKKFKLLKDKA